MNMETLAARVQRDGPLEARDAVGWSIRLCRRVELLHELGVAHGGVSAQVVLTEAADCHSAGILGDVREAATRPAYHCPERHAGQGISIADDAWGLAVTLYFLLTARLPYAGETSREIRERIATVAPAPLAVFDVGDDELQRVLDQFLARDRAKRVSRVSTLRSLLEAWHPDPNITALPPLGDEDDDTDFDDDDDAKTVMRDFGEVRAQLEAMGGEGLPDLGLPPPPAAPPPPPPPAMGGDGVGAAPPRVAPALRQPRPAAGADPAPQVRRPPRQYAATALGGFDVAARVAAARAKRVTPVTAPPVAPPALAASPPAQDAPVPVAEAAAPSALLPPPRPGPAASSRAASAEPEAPVSNDAPLAPPQFDVDDSDSEDEVATVMMDVQAADLSSAIEAALAKQESTRASGAAVQPPQAPAAPAAAPMIFPGGRPGQSLEDLVAAHPRDDTGLKRALIVAIVMLLLVVGFVVALLLGERGIL